MKTLRRVAFGAWMAAVPLAFAADDHRAGQPTLQVRARYEHVEQDGRREANALTLRARLGWSAGWGEQLRAGADLELIGSPDGDRYDQAGLNPGGRGRAVVADPEGAELNTAWLKWTSGATSVTVGRQRLVLDDARFVGDVGWRQNMQTFDAVTVTHAAASPSTALTYGYLGRVNRVFGNRHPQGNWESDSHLLHFTHHVGPATLAAHASLLDFASAPTQSCATAGASIQGATTLSPQARLTWRAAAAWQRDHGRNPQDYSARYLSAETGLAFRRAQFALAFEELGADGGGSFRTPLATLHAFNGWADQFLATPADGLRDWHLKLGLDLPAGCSTAVRWHRFSSARHGLRWGDELDVQLSRKFSPRLTALAKAADFRPHSTTLTAVTKFWLQLEYSL